jgi:hypothetical protein
MAPPPPPTYVYTTGTMYDIAYTICSKALLKLRVAKFQMHLKRIIFFP